MKRLILLLMISGSAMAQTNFKLEKIDSITKTKDQIYSDTKMFIGKYWVSAKAVIENDDKEGGAILIKGKSILLESYMLVDYTYVYDYNVTFKMKNNKFKIEIDNVHCVDAYSFAGGQTRIATPLEPFEGDNCPTTGTFGSPGLPKKKAIIMMADFKKQLQKIVDDYDKQIKAVSLNSDGW